MIKTKRTLLRWFREDDLDDIAKVLGHPDVMRFSLNGPHSREQSKAFIDSCLSQYADKGSGLFAVIYQETQQVVGYCGFYFQVVDDVEEVEISYRLHPDYWHQGLATETVKAVQEYGFETLGFKRMISIIAPENTASIRVAEKNGMQYEKAASFHNIPAMIYSIGKQTAPLKRSGL